jgi:hypothetical protein
MIKELEKIKEAQYFFGQMKKERYSEDKFRYNLSAFLSAVQSVKYYIENGNRNNADRSKWYSDKLSNKKVINFLGGRGGKRDDNIHVGPITPERDVVIPLNGKELRIGNFVKFTIKKKDGEIKGQTKCKVYPIKSAVNNDGVKIKYKFDDWDGDEDVFCICEKYLKEIKEIVEEGNRKKYFN